MLTEIIRRIVGPGVVVEWGWSACLVAWRSYRGRRRAHA